MQGSYLVPRVSFDLWKFKLSIIWIHALNFFTSRCTQNLSKNNNIKFKGNQLTGGHLLERKRAFFFINFEGRERD
jgi:hypothetical protein